MRRTIWVALAVAVIAGGAQPVAAGDAMAGAPLVVSAGRDRASLSIDDGVGTLGGERAWPMGLHLAQSDSVEAAWRRAAAGTLVRLGAPVEVGRATTTDVSASSPGYQWTEPVGDLDGDGGRDILVSTLIFTDDGGEELQLEALAGRTGASLWRSEHAGYSAAIPAPVGPEGHAGVFVVSYTSSGIGAFVAGAGEVTTTITAIGGDGTTQWEQAYSGYIVDSPAGLIIQDMVTNVAVFDAVGGQARDLLVTSLDVTWLAGQASTTATATVVDGADGMAVSSSREEGDGEVEPIAVAGPDLDTVEGDDVLFVATPYYDMEPRGRLVARSSADGSELWRRHQVAVDAWSFLESPGDMTGDGRDEVMAASMYGRTLVLDGADGTTRWRRYAHVAIPAGDVDADGLADVALVTLSYGDRRFVMGGYGGAVAEGGPPLPVPLPLPVDFVEVHYETGFAVLMSRDMGVTWRAVNAEGEVLRRDAVTMKRPRTHSAAVLQFERLGDVDGDRRPDFAAVVVVADLEREVVRSDKRIVSGGTGKTRWRPPLSLQPLHAQVDGDGADVLTRGGPGDRRALHIRDGRDGDLLWTVPSDVRGSTRGVRAADLTGDGRAEVILGGGGGGMTVLDGSDGSQLWMLPARMGSPEPMPPDG